MKVSLSAAGQHGQINFLAIDSSDGDAPFNYVIPIGERGGGDDFGIREAFELLLAFGTVQGFLIFAKAFLSKSGEIVAEKMFERLNKGKREKIIAQEKQNRENWQKNYEKEKIDFSKMVEYDWIEDKEKHDRERLDWWRAWGEAGKGDLAYSVSISLRVYIEEKDAGFDIWFNFNHDEEDYTDDYPFLRTPKGRFRELIAKESLNFQKTLAQIPDGDHTEAIKGKKEMKKEMLKHIRMIDEKEKTDSKG
jgi:hypothetical protein